PAARPDQVAYVIYTSGSTGLPKGVMVTHRSVVALFAAARSLFTFGPDDVWTLFHSFAFDFSVWEIWGPLLHGGRLVVVSQEDSRSPAATLDLLARHGVTVLNQTPSAFYQLAAADAERPGTPLALRTVVFGGEALDPARLAGWHARRPDGPDLVNMYGITETTVHVTHRPLTGAAFGSPTSVIGAGLPGFGVHLLDGGLRPVPDGAIGELYLSGPQVARGYRGRPALTASRFVADPFGQPGDRLYRSGDLARRTATGELEYLGRSDDQVKIRGFRIEPAEIESALAAAPGVAAAAVAVRTDRPGGAYLAGYVAGPHADLARIRAYLSGRLPEHMIPAVFVPLEALPLTDNGKLDRRALPAPDFSAPRPVGRGPADATEKILAGIFAQVLGRDVVGVDESFFELGGDSIMSIQLVARARAAELTLTPRQVFELRTVAELAAVARAAAAAEAEPALDTAVDAVGEVPLTPIMNAFLGRGGPWERFSQAVLVAGPAGLDLRAVQRAVQAVIDRHDMLRAVMTTSTGDGSAGSGSAGSGSAGSGSGGEYRLWVRPIGAVDAVDVVHRVELPAGDPGELLRREHAAAVARLDRSAGVLVQATWFDGDADRPGAVLLTCHHLATDGYSCQILAEDLTAALVTPPGAPVDLPGVRTSFRGWATRLAEVAVDRAAERAFWREVVADPDPALGARRFDPARDTRATVRTVSVPVPPHIAGPVLTDVPAAFHAGTDDILLAALGLAVARWRAARGTLAPTTVVGIEAHGREQHIVPGADLSRTVGWFTTQYPVRLDAAGLDLDSRPDGTASAMVKRVKEHLRAIPDRGIGYGLLRFLDGDGDGGGAGLSQFSEPQILFNYLGRVEPEQDDPLGFAAISFGGIAPAADPGLPAAAALALHVVARDGADGPGLAMRLQFPSALFTDDEVTELADLWTEALGVIADGVRRGATGGRTPSDLPLVRAKQADVDRWEARYPGLVDVLPLSPLQEGMLFHARFDADAVDFYAVQLVVDLQGPLDPTRLRTAARDLLVRHPVLRTAFPDGGGEPVQVVLDDVEPILTVLDLTRPDSTRSDSTRPDSTTALERFLQADRSTGFDLEAPPLLRLTLIRLGPDDHRLVVTNHHLVLDGWSTPLVVRDLFACYELGEAGAAGARPRPYRDFLAWLARRDRAESLAAWSTVLGGVDEPTLLAGPDLRDSAVLPAEVVDAIPADLAGQLARTARDHGVTLNTLLAAAWGLVLGRLTGRDDVIFGMTVSGRPPEIAGVESMVGLFINTVPVRVRWSPAETAHTLLERLHDAQAAVLDHQYLGLNEVQGVTGVPSGRLFDTLMVFETFPLDTAGLLDADRSGGLTAEVGWSRGYTHYPITIMLMPDDDVLRIKVEYRTDLFTSTEARTMLRRVLDVLTTLSSHSDVPLSRVDVLSADERRMLVEEWSGRGPRSGLDSASAAALVTADGDRVHSGSGVSVVDVWDGLVAG
ncbi:amino acid adenylation domain-containing protein, partial [Frankia gtarii]|uniref:amino acid adenylation domain-containing protein n=1 Tax=Frankia gtarii TaxID=2950102 RepID=UPI0021C222A8